MSVISLSPARTFRTGQTLVLAAGFVVLLLVGAATAWLVVQSRQNSQLVQQTLVLEGKLSDLRALVRQIESAFRGYLLTGDASYVTDYPQEQARARSLLADVDEGTSDSAAHNAPVVALRDAFERRLTLIENGIKAAQAGSLEDGRRIVLGGGGRSYSETIDKIISGMRQTEQARLWERSRDDERNSLFLLAATLFGTLLIVLLAAIALRLVEKSRASLEEAQKALTLSNEQLELTVSERTAELVHANAEIQRFAYIVSHDLRAPLVNIMGFTTELEAGLTPVRETLTKASEAGIDVKSASEIVDGEYPEAFGFIRAATAKMDRLINAILKLSREGRRQFVAERIVMQELFEAGVSQLAHQIDATNTTVDIGPMPVIVSDRLAVEQIFGNLFDNALKYLKPDTPGHIEIAHRDLGALNEFRVKDNGRGIDPKDHQRIFDLFRRSGVQDRKGEGIGLASVRTLVRRLGGTIDCHSSLGSGTTFVVTLPKAMPIEKGLSE